jgi:competence protein ComEC
MSDPGAAGAIPLPLPGRRNRWTWLRRIGRRARPLQRLRDLLALARPAALLRTLEAEQERWFLWLPVLIGCGIGLYFSLPVEPPPAIAAGGLAVAIGLRLAGPSALGGRLLAGALLAAAIGFAAAQVRTALIEAPVLTRPVGVVTITGWVEEVEQRGNRAYRVTLRTAQIEGLEQDRPRRVRVRVQGAADGIRIGEPVRLQARLSPPPLPALPGDYDFARRAYFQRIGAVGSSQSVLTAAPDIGPAPLSIAIWAPGENLRRVVAERIQAVLSGDRAAITTALIQGDQGGISEAAMTIMRDSGLAHILSISGLHMAIMAGALFWTIRALLALSPYAAQLYPVRAVAAVCACAGALFYLMLSGWQVPAVRSFVMIAIMFLAIVLARPALSLRNVALAALLLLVLRPENLLDVSFLMSFAATTGLVALYEQIAERRRARIEPPEPAGPIRRMLQLIGADVLTTLVAGLSVAPLGAYFFHTYQHYSVLANLLALPIVSLWLMPLVLVVLLAMPLGLEALPLQAMAYGVDALLAVGRWVASLPGAISAIPAMPLAAVVAMMLGALWLALWRRPWRWLGLVAIGLGCWKSLDRRPPDILIGRDGQALAIRLDDGRLSALGGRRSAYELARWLEHDGDRRGVDAASAGTGFRCDAIGCTARVKELTVAYVADPGKLRDTCAKADVIVVRFPRSRACLQGRLVIDLNDLRHNGTHLVFVTGGQFDVATLGAYRGARPWTRSGRMGPLQRQETTQPQGAVPPRTQPPAMPDGGADRW